MQIHGFGEAPLEERRYTLSFRFKREFDGKLPDQVNLQIPPLLVGNRIVEVAPLQLQRKSEFLNPISIYAPQKYNNRSNTFTFSEFHGASGDEGWPAPVFIYAPNIYVWDDHDSEVIFASSFTGRDDMHGMKESGSAYSSAIWGEIYVNVGSDVPVSLDDDHISWQQKSGNITPILMPIYRYNLNKYTTARYDDALDNFMGGDAGQPYSRNDIELVVLLPRQSPNRVRVTLPKIRVNNEDWGIHPIEFQ